MWAPPALECGMSPPGGSLDLCVASLCIPGQGALTLFLPTSSMEKSKSFQFFLLFPKYYFFSSYHLGWSLSHLKGCIAPPCPVSISNCVSFLSFISTDNTVPIFGSDPWPIDRNKKYPFLMYHALDGTR